MTTNNQQILWPHVELISISPLIFELIIGENMHCSGDKVIDFIITKPQSIKEIKLTVHLCVAQGWFDECAICYRKKYTQHSHTRREREDEKNLLEMDAILKRQ